MGYCDGLCEFNNEPTAPIKNAVNVLIVRMSPAATSILFHAINHRLVKNILHSKINTVFESVEKATVS
jgi:hypothetical protein